MRIAEGPGSRHAPGSARAVRAGLVAYALTQAAIVATVANGPTGDEGIYVWIGMRELAQFPSVLAAESLNGSPVVWPLVAGAVFAAGGLFALRLTAVCMTLGALWCAFETARLLLDERAAGWALLFLASSGPPFALAHLGVYDVPALAGLAAACWCAARAATGGGTRWVVTAGAALAVSIVAKHGYVFMAPVFAVLVAATSSRPRRDVLLVAVTTTSLVAAHNLAVLGALVPQSYAAFRAASLPVGRALVALEQLYFAVPLAFTLLTLWSIRDAGVASRRLAPVALCALLVWPVFHVATGTAQSAHKHVVAGFLMAAPFIGAALSRLSHPRRIVAGLAAFGVLQWGTLEYSWTNVSPAVQYLTTHGVPGDQLTTNPGTVRFRAALQANGIHDDVAERDRTLGAATTRWLVWETAADSRDDAWRRDAEASGYRELFSYSSRHLGADDHRRFGVHHVVGHVLERTGKDSAP